MKESTASVLALLQLSDSGFPSGAFSHSYGLEQLVREDRVKTPGDVEAFVSSVLRQCLATSDAPAARTAARCAAAGDLDGVIAVDRTLYRTKAASELRAASVATGRRLAEEVSATVEDVILGAYVTFLRQDKQLGTHPVAFGVTGNALGVDAAVAPAAMMLAAANAILQAAMRLGLLSHRDVQATLHRLRPQIAAMADVGELDELPLLRAFHPLQEIASMRHAFAETRLFAS